MPALTPSRAATIALVGAVFALSAAAFAPATTLANAPLKWRPFLLTHASDVRPAAPPEAGGAADRADLDEIVALQATSTGGRDAAIRYWTAQPGPTRWN